MRRLAAATALVLLASACGAASGGAAPGSSTRRHHTNAAQPVAYRGHRVHGDSVAADFALRDQHGRVIQLSALRGKVVVLTFLYTHCTDVCPLIAENVDHAVAALGPRSRDVEILAVSVDPAGDTPAAVRRFVAEHRLSSRFHYLTGPLDELRPIWQDYNLLVEARSPDRIAHSAYVLVLDARGRPRLYYPAQTPGAVIGGDLRRMVARS